MKSIQKIIFTLLFLSAGDAAEKKIHINNFSTYLYSLQNLVITENGIEMATAQKPDHTHPDFSLAFENSTEKIFSLNPRYSHSGFLGKAAEFLNPENQITLPHPAVPFFNISPDIGDFTIEFYFFLYDLSGGQVLLKKLGPTLDRINNKVLSQGIVFEIRNSRATVLFENFFNYLNRRLTVSMNEGTALRSREWYHIAVTYNSGSGLILKYLNGKIEQTAWSTPSGAPHDLIFYPCFLIDNNHPIIIGEKTAGKIDEISFYRTAKTEFLIEKYPETNGIAYSEILPFDPFGLISGVYLEGLHTPSIAEIAVRSHSEYFRPGSRIIPWTHLPVNTILENPVPVKGRYFQFMLLLHNFHSGNNGMHTPASISSLTIHCQSLPPPAPPAGISIKPGNNSAFLSWMGSTETNLAGYRISWSLSASPQNIENETQVLYIEKSSSLLKRTANVRGGEEISFILPGLENAKKYFISIAAWDVRSRKIFSTPVFFEPVIPQRFLESWASAYAEK